MSRDREYLLDILEAAKLATAYIDQKTKDEFIEDTQCQDAVIRRLEIIGEAARRVSTKTREELSELPWDSMAGMRNFLIHEYDDVDLDIVWNTVSDDLPPLINTLENYPQEKNDP